MITNCVGDSLAILRAELKSQKKHVRNLKKKSLWSKILEEVNSVISTNILGEIDYYNRRLS